ncbi:hypothetical protein PHYSODRAFT_480540 [Phytophthora sojae]|uniref:Prolyl 4-hydroxylase alpha subunit Fe(2+) 2OG dioxygenase domain-containing protein n=1 Tax=Phytophthora sojae (strain P6497) TaxID=1094619 RepID=G4YT45_PHYSP|nr:hypothetical protein PHYSODRAFT_480540 [Phytophthora sojae]EGZ25971.1 hypothetical protein PHYSODRAFT_480540 [Phytophthora sojae]|eukprot:XP_009521259.1 hypothetical protein PHYSODRAFT_480540 [Phytophthora sojae]
MDSVEEDFEDGEWPFGEFGEPGEVLSQFGSACTKISELLASADKTAGEYSFGGQAETLPVAPGIVVDGVGTIGVPLSQEQAEKLITKCEKSPFGHNYNTKMDENVRKSWQLAPDQVEITNTLWAPGLEELTKTIGQRLGYDSVPLECSLYKFLVYGEGGHFVKHQDTEKEEGMIATLVVQLPSIHEGGDLVVYRGGKERYRHDFGKAEGTAAFLPHYAVHYADAEHALEEVTKGYCLALVYSICLPSTMRNLKKYSNSPTSDDLVDAISEMVEGKEYFSLFLEQEYTAYSIESFGTGALKHIDSARFRALNEANAAVPDDKKLEFFLAKLSHKVTSGPKDGYNSFSGWKGMLREQSIDWYSSSGECLENTEDEKLGCFLNFLNPTQATFAQLWGRYGSSTEIPYTGNEGPTKHTEYSRFALVAWPAVQRVEAALEIMSVEVAVEALMARRPVGAADLRAFLDKASKRMAAAKGKWANKEKASVRFCRSFIELLIEAGDPDLATLFVTRFCPRLGLLNENTSLIPGITKILKTFDWNEIGAAMLDVLREKNQEFLRNGDSALELTLQVLDGLDDGAARQALLKLAMALTIEADTKPPPRGVKPVDLNSPKVTGILSKHALGASDNSIFETLANHFMQKDPKDLGPMLEACSQYVGDLDEESDRFSTLAAIAAKRIEWLKSEIQRLDRAFSWEMPDAVFPENPKIEAFLRGTDTSVNTVGLKAFNSLPEARKYAADCVQNGASFTMKPAGKGKKAFVTITKTRKWYNDCQKSVREYQTEVENLVQLYKFGSPAKKARTE